MVLFIDIILEFFVELLLLDTFTAKIKRFGAANILRKVVPTASAYGIEGLGGTQSVNVSTPLVLSIR
jgi:hypothetical protein